MRLVFIAAIVASTVASTTVFTAAGVASEPIFKDLVVPVAAKTKLGGGKAPTGKLVHPGTAEPGVSYATTSVNCGDTVYEISTGNGHGSCGPGNTPGSPRSCDDGKGNSSSASCSKGCGKSKGSGSCKAVAQ